MLSEFRCHTTLPAQDFDRAKAFYAEKLGFTPSNENPAAAFYDCGEGTRFVVFKTEGAPSGDHTQMGFTVSGIDAVVDDLRSHGVEFDGDGIEDLGFLRRAFFRDSEGNLIGLIEFA